MKDVVTSLVGPKRHFSRDKKENSAWRSNHINILQQWTQERVSSIWDLQNGTSAEVESIEEEVYRNRKDFLYSSTGGRSRNFQCPEVLRQGEGTWASSLCSRHHEFQFSNTGLKRLWRCSIPGPMFKWFSCRPKFYSQGKSY